MIPIFVLSIAVYIGFFGFKDFLRRLAPLPRPPLSNETQFKHVKTGKSIQFPRLTDNTTAEPVSLSVVIPAYNEEKRLTVMLEETVVYLRKRATTTKRGDPTFTYEIILVDDGSKDKTVQVASKYALDNGLEDVFRILKLEKNRGKGGAVTQVLEMEGIRGARRLCVIYHTLHLPHPTHLDHIYTTFEGHVGDKRRNFAVC